MEPEIAYECLANWTVLKMTLVELILSTTFLGTRYKLIQKNVLVPGKKKLDLSNESFEIADVVMALE